MSEEQQEEQSSVEKGEEVEETPAPKEGKTDDSTAAPVSEQVVQAVAERLKFFFSDANIRQDTFMRKLLLRDKHIPIDTLLKFNTIKQHTTDPKVVIQAAKSVLPHVLTVLEEKKSIARVKPFTKDMMDGNIPVSLMVENLPLNGTKEQYSCSTEDVRLLFASYGEVAMVKLRFDRNKKQRIPAGIAYVEFENREDMEKAALETATNVNGEAVEPTRKLKLGENELKVQRLKDHLDSKKKRKRDDEVTRDDKGEHAAPETPEHREFKVDWKPGCVVKIKGLSDKCDREAILDAVAKGLDTTVDEIKKKKIYVDFSRGQTDGAIRFQEQTEATDICKKIAEGELEIAGAKVESTAVLDGEEEKKYWDNFIEFKTKQIRHKADERSHRKGKRRRN